MICLRTRFTEPPRSSEQGFTLIEVLVAMFVGLIVMGIAVAVLGSTNSISLRVLSKSEAQLNTRDALIKVFDQVSDAESLSVCRVGIDQDAQKKITDNVLGHPGTLSVNQCKETSASGDVIAWAQPNRLCYYKTPKKPAGSAASDDPPVIYCVSRGGNGWNAEYEPPRSYPVPTTFDTQTPGTDIRDCVTKAMPSTSSPHEVYLYKCTGSGGTGSSINWPTPFGAPAATDFSMIADLGSTTTGAPLNDLFKYRKITGPETNAIPDIDLKNVVSVHVVLNARYDTKTAAGDKTYHYEQRIILRGSDAAREEQFSG